LAALAVAFGREDAMGFLDRLFGRKAGAQDDALHIYVECGRCRSRVHVRLDKRHDLTQAESGYFVRKEIMDSKCFRLMVAEITFDAGYRMQRQEIEGGRFLAAEEYEQGSGAGDQGSGARG
jgi:hypothetical protein